MPPETQTDYQSRVSQEENFFGEKEEVHNLPGVFHYWSQRYVRPKLEAIGFRDAKDLFRDSLSRQCDRRAGQETRFLSIGAGNCDLEVELAVKLREASHSRFVIDCLELNETMLQRGKLAAVSQGVANHVNAVQADFNDWRPKCEYDGVIAIHALHHVVNLEGLFTGIKESLKPGGCFAISDMIGRNGHQRWPEALSIIHDFWRRLPPSYRYNHQLKRYEEMFEDWDCSTQGFEGIRSQDILPLLLENFSFQSFVGFGNLIDPFVDRSFGPNFNASARWDLAFIDEVEQRNEEEIARGRIKPTQMFAIVSAKADGPVVCRGSLTPAFCVRRPDPPPSPAEAHAETVPHYGPEALSNAGPQELEFACRRLEELTREREELKALVSERTAWALQLDKELQARTAWALQLDKEFQERTTWALDLDRQLQEEIKRPSLRSIGRRVLSLFRS